MTQPDSSSSSATPEPSSSSTNSSATLAPPHTELLSAIEALSEHFLAFSSRYPPGTSLPTEAPVSSNQVLPPQQATLPVPSSPPQPTLPQPTPPSPQDAFRTDASVYLQALSPSLFALFDPKCPPEASTASPSAWMVEPIETLVFLYIQHKIQFDDAILILSPHFKRLICITANYRHFIRYDVLDNIGPPLSFVASEYATAFLNEVHSWATSPNPAPLLPLWSYFVAAATALKTSFNLQKERRPDRPYDRNRGPPIFTLTPDQIAQLSEASAAAKDSTDPKSPSATQARSVSFTFKPSHYRRGGRRN
ncbi:MAG: hypothetical protein ACAH17_00775 [Candidatus Paceibacterota bacterium]